MTSGGAIARAPRPSSLADVLDLILDKGLVIDAYVRISAVGIELLTIDARIVIASVDTYLHYAEAVNRLDLTQTETQGLTGLFGDESSNGASSDGRSSNGGSSARRPAGGRTAVGPGSGADESGGRRRQRGDGDSDEGEASDSGGRGRNLARRLGEKGRWNE